MPRHIVIVEDEPDLAKNYCDALRRQGYEVSHCADLETARSRLARSLPDLAIIDVGLGDQPEGGFDLCRELRAQAPSLPIVFLTARNDDFDVISGLRLGADDYLSKDISLAHLMARVTALLRRVDAISSNSAAVDAEQLMERGVLTVHLDRMRVQWQQQDIDLTVTELWIVHALAEHPGHVKNRQQLMDAANVVLDDNTITSHIKRIRKKFVAVDRGFDAIKTAYGMGYRWVP